MYRMVINRIRVFKTLFYLLKTNMGIKGVELGSLFGHIIIRFSKNTSPQKQMVKNKNVITVKAIRYLSQLNITTPNYNLSHY